MVNVLKATQEQYEQLNGYSNGTNQIQFAVDGNGNWIIGVGVLSDPCFSHIASQLSSLAVIPWSAPAENPTQEKAS